MNTTFEHFVEEKTQNNKEQIKAMLGTNDFVFFFEKNKEIYGAPEESRLMFARMKNPDPEDNGWVKEANFSGLNLNKALKGEKTESLFSHTYLTKIKILDQDAAYDKLSKLATDTDKIKTVLSDDGNPHPEAPDAAPGIQQLKDKK